MDQPDQPPSSDPTPSSFFRKILQVLGFGKTPDTAEDLGHELQELIEDGEEQGILSSQEGMMLSSLIDFRDTLVNEIMTPRTEMICASATTKVPEVIATIRENGFSRLPIYSKDLDHIDGILHAKDLLQFCTTKNQNTSAGSITRPALFVSESHRILDLLPDFKKKKMHMAIVTDEFGGVRGLITLEDIIEEIVGEIIDESDKEDAPWKIIDDTTVLTDAKIDIEEVEEHFGIQLPEGPYESMGGLVINQLGRLPVSGEIVEFECLQLEVVSASKRKINTLKIMKLC